jgi:hypothetical protein
MKRGKLLPLLVALVLLFPAQTAFANGSQKASANAKSHPAHAVAKGHVPVDKASGPVAAQSETRADKGPRTAPKHDAEKAPGRADEKSKAKGPSDRENSYKEPKYEPPKSVSPADECPEPPECETPITVCLHEPHVGADSRTFGNEPGETGGLTDAVVWHFVLNQLDHGTAPASLTVTFKNAGTKSVTGSSVGNGSTQHFYVGTPAHDVLLGASAVVNSCDAGKLVLSHVAWNCPSEPEEPPCPPEPPDEPTCTPEPPDEPDEPYAPYTADEAETETAEPYLPYTGDPGSLLLGFALGAALSGGRIRYWSRKKR